MAKFANVVTIEVAPGRRDQVVTLLAAHKARLKNEPGTLHCGHRTIMLVSMSRFVCGQHE